VTDHELLAALYEQQGRILAHAGTTARKLDEVSAATSELAGSVGGLQRQFESRFAAQDQRCADHHRRTVDLEEWRKQRDKSVSDTQRNEVEEARAQVAKMQADEAAKRRAKWKWVAGVAGGVIVAAASLIMGMAAGGCF